MKKILFALASVALVSCTQDEDLAVIAPEAIKFGNSFVENSTRAIDATLNTGTLESFKVYGYVKGKQSGEGTVNIFNGVEVKKVTEQNQPQAGDVVYDNSWWYAGANTQYWIEGNEYKFAALVNGTAVLSTEAHKMPISISYNAAEQEDLLYATWSVESYSKTQNTNGVVAFTFDHLLSKVHFTFQNTITSNTSDMMMYTYRVSDIKITNAYMQGSYDVKTDNNPWTVKTEVENPRGEVAFGNISIADDTNSNAIEVGSVRAAASSTSHYSKLMIPYTYNDLIITCKIETLLNGTVIDTEETHTITPSSVTLAPGHAYNFIISKGNPGEVIKFSVTRVNEWAPQAGPADTPVVNPAN